MNKVTKPINGKLLKRARKKLGLTQQRMVEYLGLPINQQLLSFWENNQRAIPEEILKIARQIKKTKKKDALKSILSHDFFFNLYGGMLKRIVKYSCLIFSNKSRLY